MDNVIADALGNEIVIGNMYGYSTNKSGWAYTVIGIAKSITPTGRVVLEVTKTQTFLYGKPTDYNNRSNKTTIRSHMLFPVRGVV